MFQVIPMHIRHPNAPEDRDRVLTLATAFTAEGLAHGYRAPSREQLAAVADTDLWLAEEGSTLIGYAYGQPRPSGWVAVAGPEERIFDLEDLYLLPKHRGTGCGTRLMRRMETDLIRRGFQRWILASTIRDLAAVERFYQRLGFTTWSIAMHKRL